MREAAGRRFAVRRWSTAVVRPPALAPDQPELGLTDQLRRQGRFGAGAPGAAPTSQPPSVAESVGGTQCAGQVGVHGPALQNGDALPLGTRAADFMFVREWEPVAGGHA